MPTKRASDIDAKILKLAEPIARLLKEGEAVSIRNHVVRIVNVQGKDFELVTKPSSKRSK